MLHMTKKEDEFLFGIITHSNGISVSRITNLYFVLTHVSRITNLYFVLTHTEN